VDALNLQDGAAASVRWVEVPLGAPRVRFYAAAPPLALRGDVEHLWRLEAVAPLPAAVAHSCASRASVDLVLTLDGHFAERAEASLFGPGGRGAYLIGPTVRATEVVSSGRCRVLAARLRPGRAAGLLRTSARELRDRVIRLEEACPVDTEALAEALGRRDVDAATSFLYGTLFVLGRRAGAPDPLITEALGLLEQGRGALAVEAAARTLGSTVRHLERRFREHVGLGPKRWTRIARMNHAMRLLGSGGNGMDFAAVVDACGFYDQAHLIREFRELAGLTPGAYVRRATRCSDERG